MTRVCSASNVLAHELFHPRYNENWFLRAEHTLENGHLGLGQCYQAIDDEYTPDWNAV